MLLCASEVWEGCEVCGLAMSMDENNLQGGIGRSRLNPRSLASAALTCVDTVLYIKRGIAWREQSTAYVAGYLLVPWIEESRGHRITILRPLGSQVYPEALLSFFIPED
jgi:hypothetical protein